jgi:tetratricopeptide (TPR) repeat protein
LSGERLLDFSPAYLHLHIICRQIFGDSNLVLEFVHLVLTSLACIILFYVLARFHTLLVSFIGALAFALDYGVIVNSHVFEPEALLVFFLLGFVFFLVGADGPRPILAGIFFGLGILARPSFMLVLCAVPFLLFCRRLPRSRRWKSELVLFCVPVLASFLLLGARNAVIARSFSPMVMNPGDVFYEGNHASSKGLSIAYLPILDDLSLRQSREIDYHHAVYRRLARLSTGVGLTPAEVNRYWFTKALNFLRDNPGFSLRRALTKTFYFFHSYEWHDLLITYRNDLLLRAGHALTVPFAVIAAFAAVGLVILLRNWRDTLLFYALMLNQLLLSALFYVSSRQRMAVVPFFIFFACSALQYFLDNRPKRLFLTAVLVSLSIVFYLPTDLTDEEDHQWFGVAKSRQYLNSAFQGRDQSKLGQASVMSSRALAAAPWYFDSSRPASVPFHFESYAASALKFIPGGTLSTRLDRAVLCEYAGRLDEAEELLSLLVGENRLLKRDCYQSSEPYFYLGRIEELRRDYPRAADLLAAGLARSPGDPWILSHLAALTGNPSYNARLFRYYDDIHANFFLGQAYLDIGDAIEAGRHFTCVVRVLPEYRPAAVYLAASLAAAGQHEQAASVFADEARMSQDPVFEEDRILLAFAVLARENSEDPARKHQYATALYQYGHSHLALMALRSALEMDPTRPYLKQEIANLEQSIRSELDGEK